MKFIKSLILLAAAVPFFASCEDDDVNSAQCTLGFASSTVEISEASSGYLQIPINVTGKRNGPIHVTIEATPAGQNGAVEGENYIITDKTLNLNADTLSTGTINVELKIINDNEINQIPIEIGQGINLLNSLSIKCLNNLSPIDTVDFTSFTDMESAVRTIKKIKGIIPNRKYTIAGNVRVPTLGLCPLNNDSAIISRLSCKAPCHRGGFALKDPSLKKIYPFTCDGFCRMHMFEDKILEDFSRVDFLQKAGVNEFVFDFSALNSKFVPVLLNNFFQSQLIK